jgi:hypothetical protein
MIKQQFEISAGYKKWTNILLGVGGLALVLGIIFLGMSKDEVEQTRFWASLLQNSVFFLLVVNASMFFICATTLAHGGWQMAFRRVPEAISSLVPVFGILAMLVFVGIVFGHRHDIYHWLDKEHVEHDPILKGKSGFLNPTFFMVWSVVAIGLWSFVGAKMRKLSSEADEKMDGEQGAKYVVKNTAWGAAFLVIFGLTVGSTIPWLWLMSIDAHWYSTMYSWYTFASTFVAGMALIALWVVYLKNKGYLELTNNEHLHDIAKFMFAFSIFWTYLWFSQYMLIWYANIPEETVYFKHRVQGPYKAIFFLNLIINFLAPLLILMKRSAKRNYTLVALMAVVIIFGHWIDFYQMVMGSLMKEHVELGVLDFGILAFFVGVMIFFVAKALASKPLIAKYHPFLKESIIHHT